MFTAQSPDFSLPIVNGAYNVASYHVGKSLVNVFRNSSTGGKIRNGDYHLNRSRPLMQQFYSVLPNADQDNIKSVYQEAQVAKEKVEGARGFFQKYLKAKEYEEVTRQLFYIVETASRRAADKSLMAQISEALAGRDPQPGSQLPPLGTTTTLSNPFSDSHGTSSPGDAEVDAGDQVEMTILESEATGEAAIILGLHRRDGTTQEIATTIPLAAVAGDRISGEADTRTVDSTDTLEHGMFGPPTEVGSDDGQ